MPLYKYRDDLTFPDNEDYDIMAVYEEAHFSYITDPLHSASKILLWERKTEQPICTLDGVEYSEETLRSMIKKATT